MIRRVPALPDLSPDHAPAVRRLRRAAIGLVALALIVAGGSKLLWPEPAVTMLSRYLPTPRAAKAGGCLEIAVALWLLSGRSPRLAPCVAGGALAGMGLLIGSELSRERPLPCGCFAVRMMPQDTVAVRRDLSVALGRDVFLVVLCGVAVALVPPAGEPGVGPRITI